MQIIFLDVHFWLVILLVILLRYQRLLHIFWILSHAAFLLPNGLVYVFAVQLSDLLSRVCQFGFNALESVLNGGLEQSHVGLVQLLVHCIVLHVVNLGLQGVYSLEQVLLQIIHIPLTSCLCFVLVKHELQSFQSLRDGSLQCLNVIVVDLLRVDQCFHILYLLI